MTDRERAALEGVTPSAIYMRRWRAKNAEKNSSYMKSYRRGLREKVITAYGGRCDCCGEDKYEFLSIDHVNGGGTRERLASPDRGASLPMRLIREGFPGGFRILCHNCNQAIGFYGTCPHESEVAAVIRAV